MVRAAYLTLASLTLWACEPAAKNEMAVAPAAGAPDDPARPFEFIAMRGENMWAMVAPDDADALSIAEAAKDRCGTNDFCQVRAWSDRISAARALPMTYQETNSQLFSYALNRDTGYEETMWDCERFPQPNADNCLDDISEAEQAELEAEGF